MSTDINAKINMLLTSDSRYVNLSRTDALSQMVQDGVITRAQYDEIINGTVFISTNTSTSAPTESTSQLMGAYFTLINPTAQVQQAETAQPLQAQLTQQSAELQSPQTPQKRFHPMFKDLLLTPDGKVDTDQFSLEAIKAKYNSDKYIIEESIISEHVTEITVKNKITGKPVEILKIDTYAYNQYEKILYDNSGNVSEMLTFWKDNISSYTTYSSQTDSITYVYNLGDVNDIDYIQSCNEDSITTTYYSEGKISSREIKDVDFDTIVKKEIYNNGKLACEFDQDGNVTKNYITADIINCFDEEHALKDLDEFNDIIMDINDSELMKVVVDSFEQAMHFDIRVIINYFVHIDNELKEKYLGHIDNILNKEKLGPSDGYFDAWKINNAQSEDEFTEKILNLNSYNLSNILMKFGVYATEENPFLKIKFNTLMEEIDERVSDEETRLKLYNNIIENLFEESKTRGTYSDDIRADVESHPNDFKKLTIDIIRLINRNNSKSHYENYDYIESNGKIDKIFKQGGIGDCWLLASIIAIKDKDPKFFEKCMTQNSDGSITVKFPLVEKSYNVTQEQIKQMHHLAKGDADVRVIEIAVDNYLKELAYEKGPDKYYDNTDINGGTFSETFNKFFTKGKSLENPDIEKIDFNNKNKVYSLAIKGEDNLTITAYDENDNQVKLHTHHAYALVGSDREFLFLINPHDSSQTIRLLKADAKKVNIDIEEAEL